MKISELNTERAADVLCEITPMIEAIAGDPEVTKAFRLKLPEGAIVADVLALNAKIACALVASLLKTHKQDVYGVLAAVNGVTVEDIAAQTFSETMKQAKEVLSDKELLSFFGLSR